MATTVSLNKSGLLIGYEWFDQLLYCIQEGYSARLTTVMLVLLDGDTDDLRAAWAVWRKERSRSYYCNADPGFIEAIAELTGANAAFCTDCATVMWEEDSRCVADGDQICDSCFEDNYFSCANCGRYVTETTTVDDDIEYCSSCLERYATYCDECEEWYRLSSGHTHDCECEALHPHFDFPANSHGTITENERLTVELPKGVIDDEGMARIARMVHDSIRYQQRASYEDPTIYYNDIVTLLGEVGHLWQAKRGNFPKRLSSRLYTKHQIKLPEGTLSEVGNIARAHSSQDATWFIEVTRDLNESASFFFHSASCWWSSYSKSRCALKSWGGLALRSFGNASTESPNGRAWIQPLNARLRPTHDTLGAHAYVVFNGYGALEGYTAARIVAYLTSKSYRKLNYDSDAQYVNGASGFLIADQDVCDGAGGIYFEHDEHDTCDARTFRRTACPAIA